jgi:hypothetical protein
VDPAPTPEAAARRAEERERVVRALATLPPHHRTVIMLNDLEGLSYREIAEVLDIPMGTVMSRLHHARKRLRAALGPLLAVVLAVVAAAALTLVAPSAVAAQQVVRFSAQVLLAGDPPGDSPPGGEVRMPPDELLRQLLPKLQQLFRYKEYRLLHQYRGEAPVGGVQRWPVPGDRALEIAPEGMTGTMIRLRVRLLHGSTTEVTTNIQAAPRAPAVIGGPRHDGNVLIVIVWPNP